MTTQTIGAPSAVIGLRLSRPVAEPLLAGIAATLLTMAGTWTPSSSGDEAATASAVSRSLPDLVRMGTGTVDAVHALYYVVLQAWAQVFGHSPFGMRSFSAIGVGFGAAATVMLARRIGGARLVPVVGALYITIPMTTWAASEARSYAWVIALNAWSAVALLRARERGGRAWMAYALVAALSMAVFIYSALVVLVHAATVLTSRALSRRQRTVGLSSIALAAAAASPVVYLAVLQKAQVSWIGPFSTVMVRSAMLQWFGDSPLYAVPAWTGVAIGAVAVWTRRSLIGADARPLVFNLVLPWLIVPTALLLIATAVGQPSYVARYAAISLPALALMVGVGATAFGRRGLAAVVLLGVLSVPTYLAQRLPLANGTDWKDSASVVARWGTPGEAFYFAQTGAATDPRLMLSMYRPDFIGLRDIAQQWTAASLGGLWDTVVPAEEAIKRAGYPTKVIVIADNVAPWWHSLEEQSFAKNGYTTVDSSIGPTTSVILVERKQ